MVNILCYLFQMHLIILCCTGCFYCTSAYSSAETCCPIQAMLRIGTTYDYDEGSDYLQSLHVLMGSFDLQRHVSHSVRFKASLDTLSSPTSSLPQQSGHPSLPQGGPRGDSDAEEVRLRGYPLRIARQGMPGVPSVGTRAYSMSSDLSSEHWNVETLERSRSLTVPQKGM